MSDGEGQKGGIWSTVMIIALVAGLLLVFNFVCRKDSAGGGCMPMGGGCAAGPTPTSPYARAEEYEREPDTTGVAADTVILKNEEMEVRILGWDSFLGFRVDKVELKDFTMKVDERSTKRIPVQLLTETRFSRGTHAGFEVMARKAPPMESLETKITEDSTGMSFTWKDSLGRTIKSRITLMGYQIKFEQLAADTVPSRYRLVCAQGLLPTEPGDNTEIGLYQVYYRDKYDEVQWLKASKIRKLEEGEEELEPGPYDWVALRNKYFAAVILPTSPVDATDLGLSVLEDQRISLDNFDVEFDLEKGRPGFNLYFGPQDYERLDKLGPNLQRVVELGGSAFRWLGVILLKIFQFFYRIIGNYGVVIIVFAILIKLIFLPLSQVQQRSMAKMQTLQPKLKELQQRFKDDPKRLNEETMKLYRMHGASPFKGCLPMLIQLPVFFGLYAVLRNAIELRGAEFMRLFTVTVKKPFDFLFIHIPAGDLTWLADLSQHDPFYILPVLMGVASVFQSLRSNVDPRQRLTTLIFPILITVVFLNFPSGLQLYWLMFNLLSLVEFAVFRRGVKTGGTTWKMNKKREIPSGKS